MNKHLKILKGYAIYGVITGTVLLILAILFSNSNSEFSYSELHGEFPGLYLLDLLPLIMGGAFYFVGYRAQQLKDKVYSKSLLSDKRF